MELISFVTVKGAMEAIELYKDVFNASIEGHTTMLNTIDGFKEEKYDGLVGHMTVKIGTSRFFMNDYLEGYPVEMGTNIQFVVDFESEEALREAFRKLSEEGVIVSKLQEVHWGALFGTVKDKFGVTWQIYFGHK